MKTKIKIAFKDFWHGDSIEQIEKHNIVYRFLLKHYDVQIDQNAEILIYSCYGIEHLLHRGLKIFYTGENLTPNFDECDFSLSFSKIDDERNFTLPLFRIYPEYDALVKYGRGERIPFHERKFCNFVYSNKFADRRRKQFFNKLNKVKKVDSGGRFQNNIGRGIDDKVDFLKDYIFTIAFENSSTPGYTTEKILHAFGAKTIPIYWGDPEVNEYFNTDAFINCHDYENFDEVIEEVIAVSEDEEKFNRYMDMDCLVDREDLSETAIFAQFERFFSAKRSGVIDQRGCEEKYYRRLRLQKFQKKYYNRFERNIRYLLGLGFRYR